MRSSPTWCSTFRAESAWDSLPLPFPPLVNDLFDTRSMYPPSLGCELVFTDLLLTNRIWQKWLDVTSKNRLQKDWFLCWFLSYALLLPPSLDSFLWRSQLPVSFEADLIPVKPWRDCKPVDTLIAASWEILSQGYPAELCPDSWPAETVSEVSQEEIWFWSKIQT